MVDKVNDDEEVFYLDRCYHGGDSSRGGGAARGGANSGFNARPPYNAGTQPIVTTGKGFSDKKCLVCNKTGCWSTNHTLEERRRAKSLYLTMCQVSGVEPQFAAYLAAVEGDETEYVRPATIAAHFTQSATVGADYNDDVATVNYLTNAAFLHHMTGKDVRNMRAKEESHTFVLENRYNQKVYQGILPDSGVAEVSTYGMDQYLALKAETALGDIDEARAGEAQVKFGQGKTKSSVGTITMPTALRDIDFHVINAPTPFLMCLGDMDKLHIYYNNLIDKMIQGTKALPVVRK